MLIHISNKQAENVINSIYKMYDMYDKYMTCIYKMLQNSEKVKNSCWNAGNRDSELHRTKIFLAEPDT